jgi:DNA-binding IclR family transcriptional regulator
MSDVQQRTDAYKKAEKYVGELIKETGYRSVFMIEEHGNGVYLHTQHGESPSWEHEVEGNREHLHVLAAGKVILAHLSEEKVESIIDRHGLPEQTKWTISDPTELRENLADIREQGYAFNRGENIDGVHAIGTPALGPDGRVVGGFSISGPSHRLDEQSLRSEPLDALLGIVNEYELELSLS